MLLTGFQKLESFFPPCHPGEAEKVTLIATLDDDISPVFPYLNATIKGAKFDPKSQAISFKWHKHGITLHSKKIAITQSQDRAEAEKVLNEIKDLINNTYSERDTIQPSYKTRSGLMWLTIYKLLPQINCGECGVPTCMAFANKMVGEELEITACRHIFTEKYREQWEQLLQLLQQHGYTVLDEA